MNLEKQQLLVKYLLSDTALFIKTNPILLSKHWDPELKPVIGFMKSYFDEFKGLPTPQQIGAETGVRVQQPEPVPAHEVKYAETQLETFCRNKAIEHAIFASVELLEDQNFSEMERQLRDAISISLQRNLGVDYFADPEARLKILLEAGALIPTKLKKLDDAMGGGLARQTMLILAAPSGVGKSLSMSNIGLNLCQQGLNGVYISLELSEALVSKRHDSMVTGISQKDILKNITETAIKVRKVKEDGYGDMTIKYMPPNATTSAHLRAYLKEYQLVHGRTPDFLIVDYLDLMGSTEKVSAENVFTKDKYVSEELRAIASEFDLILITASQLNRGAQLIENLEELNQAHIAGGLSKIMTADNVAAIIQTPQMKARNEMMFKMLKTRSSSGVGSYFLVKFNPVSLRLTNMEEDQDNPTLENRIAGFRAKAKDEREAPPPPPGQGMKQPTFGGAFDAFQV
jgi:KaiC/GvpD/RAD55 family RecA-like ATPase